MRLPIPEFKVLLFGPGLPTSGQKALAHFENGVLEVRGRGHWYTTPASSVDLRVGGFDGRQWLVSWDNPNGRFTAILQGENAMRLFVDEAPGDLVQRLQRLRKQHKFRSGPWRGILILLGGVLLLPLLLLAGALLQADRLSQWVAQRIPVEQQIQLGDKAFQQLQERMQLLPRYTLANQVVERLGVRLTVGTRFPYRFHVARDPSVNAYALPGGNVVLSSGLLLAARDADEVAGVLAHEIGHVEQGHSLHRLIHALGLRALLAAFMQDYDADVWKHMADKLSDLSYGRGLEGDADQEALSLLRRAGLPLEGVVGFFSHMATTGEQGLDLLASHPASSKRLATLASATRQTDGYAGRGLDLDWDTVMASLAQQR